MAAVNPAAERHYDVRWWRIQPDTQPKERSGHLASDQFIYFNANGFGLSYSPQRL